MDESATATAEKTPGVGGADSVAGAMEDDASGRPQSPAEQIEERLQVTSPRMWLALLGFLVLIVSSLVWGVFGKAADEVHGQGTILPSAGLYEIAAPIDGTITSISVAVGDHVADHTPLVKLTEARGETGDVGSFVSGKVVALFVRVGTFVKAGTPIATIEPDGSDLQGILYVPVSAGKRIKSGMPVYLSPSTASASAYGSMVGAVSSISSLAVTHDRLDLTLGKNAPLADVLRSGGPVLEVVVKLDRANTPSGFRWSTGNGPDFLITSGTSLEGTVVIGEASPTKVLLGS